MLNRSDRLLPLAFLIACTGEEPPDSDQDDTGTTDTAPDPRWSATLEELEPWMEEWSVPGLGIAIVQDGAPRYAAGLGVRALSTGEPVTADTLFESSSAATKPLIAATLLDLSEEGLVDFHAPVHTWLPGVGLDPTWSADIDLHRLLTMRAGVDAAVFRSDCTPGGSIVDYLDSTGEIRSVAPPDAIWLYTATPAILGAGVIETVGAAPWTEVVADRILTPIGATGAGFDSTAALTQDHAAGHIGGWQEQALDEREGADCPEFQASWPRRRTMPACSPRSWGTGPSAPTPWPT